MFGERDQLAGVLIAERFVDVEAELGQFDRDGGIDFAVVDELDGAEAMVTAEVGLFNGGDAFAEVVEGGEDAFAIDVLTHGEGFIERVAGDEAAGERLGEGGVFHPAAEGFLLAEEDEKRAQHERDTASTLSQAGD